MTGSALIVDAVVRDGDVHITDHFYRTRRVRAAKKWGDGTALKVRIEPEEDAVLYSQYKHLFGHLYEPVSKRHGETVAEVNVRMKLHYLPDDGRTSLTELNREEMKSFIESVEQDIRETDPDSWGDCLDAMALYEGGQRGKTVSTR